MLELRNLFERALSSDRQFIIDGLECLLVRCKAVAAQTSAWLHDDALEAFRQTCGEAERCSEGDI
ncbi:MAG: hypothetical protein JNL61_04485 [Rhizobiaceae bacterium]|nr:hypothetical protein [Rhizobiaceae bacterium]